MSRIEAVNYESSTGKTRELLDAVKQKLGLTPNMVKTMAHSPAVLEAYLNFSGALAGGSLNAKIREQIALVAAEVNGCGYCAAAHTAIGTMAGLDEKEIAAVRSAESADAKAEAALKFARTLTVNRGRVSDEELDTLKKAGYSDGEIGELIGAVALNIFTNYFNEVAQTELDFPRINVGTAAA